jgi:ABC-type sugar transport system substrate-binding protein
MNRLTIAAGLVAVGALLLTGCSSTETAEPASTDSNSSVDEVAVASQEWIAPYLERPTSIGIVDPIEGGIAEGKEIYYLQCGVPACQETADTIKASMDTIGWDFKTVDAGGTPEEMKAALAQAISDKPDGVIISGTNHSMFPDELAKLKELGIPVMNMTTADPPSDDVLAVFFEVPEFEATGERLAHYALSQTGKKTNAVSFMISAFSNTEIVANFFNDTIKENCDVCTSEIIDIPITSLGTDLVPQVVTYLQAHPDVNWVNLGYADMIVGMPDALKAAGISKDVKFVSIGPSELAFEALRNGDYLVALDSPSTYDMTWRHADALARHFNGESIAPSIEHNYPVWVVTKDNIPVTEGTFPLVEDYTNQYKAIWGL